MSISWPILIILIAFLIIVFIILRNFPALAVLDVNNIPEEKEEMVKEKIIKARIKRKFSFFDKFFKIILDYFNKAANSLWLKLDDFKERKKKIKEEKSLENLSPSEKNKHLFFKAKNSIFQENWIEAEKFLIELISIDDRSFKAFFLLGDVYFQEEKWQEAKQTLLYALKLAELQEDSIDFNDLSNLKYSLALVNKELNDIGAAIKSVDSLLEMAPNNPRYLDLMLDLCIINKDKISALNFLDKIKEVNPDNNNISDWQEEIDKI